MAKQLKMDGAQKLQVQKLQGQTTKLQNGGEYRIKAASDLRPFILVCLLHKYPSIDGTVEIIS